MGNIPFCTWGGGKNLITIGNNFLMKTDSATYNFVLETDSFTKGNINIVLDIGSVTMGNIQYCTGD